jgi:hypothetical protein
MNENARRLLKYYIRKFFAFARVMDPPVGISTLPNEWRTPAKYPGFKGFPSEYGLIKEDTDAGSRK